MIVFPAIGAMVPAISSAFCCVGAGLGADAAVFCRSRHGQCTRARRRRPRADCVFPTTRCGSKRPNSRMVFSWSMARALGLFRAARGEDFHAGAAIEPADQAVRAGRSGESVPAVAGDGEAGQRRSVSRAIGAANVAARRRSAGATPFAIARYRLRGGNSPAGSIRRANFRCESKWRTAQSSLLRTFRSGRNPLACS